MGKYDRLGAYLREQGCEQVPMTFAEIERVVGTKLPSSQKHQAWWSNSTSNNVMTQVWLDAGYRSEQVDTAGRKLVFRRIAGSSAHRGMADSARDFSPLETEEKKSRRSPLFGALKGTFTLAPDYGPASPMFTDEEWAEIEKDMDEDWDRIGKGMSDKNK